MHGTAGTGGDQELQGPLHVLIASILTIMDYDGDPAPLGSHTSWDRCFPGSNSWSNRCPPPAASPQSAEPWRGGFITSLGAGSQLWIK